MTAHAPIPDYTAARQAMADSQLRPQGVSDPAVIAAMSLVPRELFVPEEQRPLAYADRSIPLGGGRLLRPAANLGLLLTALAPSKGEKALVVGAATGYSAAVLTELGVVTVALEEASTLVEMGRERGLSIVEGPLAKGHKRGSPYDFILIDGAVEFIPDSLVGQLKEGGRLGAGLLNDGGIARLIVGRKAGGGFGFHSIADSSDPALPGFRRPKAFTF